MTPDEKIEMIARFEAIETLLMVVLIQEFKREGLTLEAVQSAHDGLIEKYRNRTFLNAPSAVEADHYADEVRHRLTLILRELETQYAAQIRG